MAEKNPFADRWLKNQYNERNPGQRNHPDSQPSRPAAEPLPPLWFVSGKVEAAGGGYVAIASAIPNGGPQSALKAKRRAFPTKEQADAGLKEIKAELGEAVRAEGGRVSDADRD